MKEKSVHQTIKKSGRKGRKPQSIGRKGTFLLRNSRVLSTLRNTRLRLKSSWLIQQKKRMKLMKRQALLLLFSDQKFRSKSSLQLGPSHQTQLLLQVISSLRVRSDPSLKAKISQNEVILQFRICTPNNTLQV